MDPTTTFNLLVWIREGPAGSSLCTPQFFFGGQKKQNNSAAKKFAREFLCAKKELNGRTSGRN
jgi:hypothetical protein